MKALFLVIFSTLLGATPALATSKITCDCGTYVDFGGSQGTSWVSSGFVTIYADPSNYHSAAKRACVKLSGELEISYRCRLAR